MKQKKITFPPNLQDYLAIGYLFLLVLGISSEAAFYAFLDINIIRYYGISDILLSPLVYLVNPRFLLIFALLSVVVYFIFWWQKKKELKKGTYQKPTPDNIIVILVFMFISLYMGLGLGRGMKAKQRLDNRNFEAKHIIIFNNGKKEKIKLINANSQYVFYVKDSAQVVSITPISGNVHKIEQIAE